MTAERDVVTRMRRLQGAVEGGVAIETENRLDGLLLELIHARRSDIEALIEALSRPSSAEKDRSLGHNAVNPLSLSGLLFFSEHLRLLFEDEDFDDPSHNAHQALHRVLFELFEPRWDYAAVAEMLKDHQAFKEDPQWLKEMMAQVDHPRQWQQAEGLDGDAALAYVDHKKAKPAFRLCEDMVGAAEFCAADKKLVLLLSAFDGMTHRTVQSFETDMVVPTDNMGKWLLNHLLQFHLEQELGKTAGQYVGLPEQAALADAVQYAVRNARKDSTYWLSKLLHCLSFEARECHLADLYPDEYRRLRSQIDAVLELDPVLLKDLKRYYFQAAQPSTNLSLSLVHLYQGSGVHLSIGNGQTLVLPQKGEAQNLTDPSEFSGFRGVSLFHDRDQVLTSEFYVKAFRYARGDTLMVTTDGLLPLNLNAFAHRRGQGNKGLEVLHQTARQLPSASALVQAFREAFPADIPPPKLDDIGLVAFKECQ